jgi:hypothetical protein
VHARRLEDRSEAAVLEEDPGLGCVLIAEVHA